MFHKYGTIVVIELTSSNMCYIKNISVLRHCAPIGLDLPEIPKLGELRSITVDFGLQRA